MSNSNPCCGFLVCVCVCVQRRVISMVRPIMEEAMIGLYLSFSPRPSALVIADLGCSSGPNAFFAVSELIKTVENLRRKMGHDDPPVYQVFLNDLPGNDFNAVFRALPSSQDNQAQCFFAGVPGSFYGRLFPSKTLHFVHSSYSLHWLSQVMACPTYFSLLCLKEKKIWEYGRNNWKTYSACRVFHRQQQC